MKQSLPEIVFQRLQARRHGGLGDVEILSGDGADSRRAIALDKMLDGGDIVHHEGAAQALHQAHLAHLVQTRALSLQRIRCSVNVGSNYGMAQLPALSCVKHHTSWD